MRVSAKFAAALVLMAASSQAAYQYIHYPSRTNFTPIYEKFNLAALPNNTVTFFVADQTPNSYANNEFGSVLSQVRQAIATWNSVAISDLRVAFGGMQSYTDNPTVTRPGASIPGAATPGGDILFVDTPGVLGLSAPTISTVPVQGPAGQFYPIVRGVVMISRDTGSQPWPSSAETFFATAVHEIGHAVGLQHTWTGSAMSQGVIRTTSRARPLDADDIASLAVLYGKAGWQANYGTITGRVSFAGNGGNVSLGSVVAIAANGPAVSALTNPDGTYRIEGVPAGFAYNVYAHALPPDALPGDGTGLRLPVDAANVRFNASGPFQTLLYDGGAGTLDAARAAALNVAAGSTLNVNFTVQARASVRTYDVQTYSRITTATREWGPPGDASVVGYPGFINTSSSKSPLVIVRGQAPAVLPVPQSVTILGVGSPATTANSAVLAYSNTPGDYIALYFGVPRDTAPGPRHMIFNFGDDVYVLPYGVNLVQKGPPVANAVASNADGTVTVSGAGFGPDSRVFFDGAQGTGTVFSGSDGQGTLTVVPPPGANGQSAQISVYGSDGQNSTMIPGAATPTYTYPGGGAYSLTVAPNNVPAGTTAQVEVNVSGMTLVDGQVTVGFGSEDVQVRRVWVLSPTRALVNVAVAANATTALSEVSVISGMQVAAAASAFQVLPARAGGPAIASVGNADASQTTLAAGQLATIFGVNLAGAQVTVNDIAANVVFANGNQVNFGIPSGVAAGPATLRLTTSAGAAQPIALQIDATAPAVVNLNTATASAGDVLQFGVSGVDAAAAGRLRVTVSGIEMNVQSVNTAGGLAQVQVAVTQSFGSGQVPLAVWVDATVSAAVNVVIR